MPGGLLSEKKMKKDQNIRAMQQILIVGAGAVGGFFGAHLARAHPEKVSFLLRPRTLQAVKARGLTVRSAADTFTVHPKAASDPRHLPAPDLIILTVKAYDLDDVLRQLEPVVRDETVIMTLQNGITAEDQIAAKFERDCVVGGVAFIHSKIIEPGVIEHYKRGAVTMGEFMGHQSPRALGIAELFQVAGIPCDLSQDIRRAKWEKMCWNCVFNPLTVMINDRVSKALDHPEMLRVISSIVQEVAAVATAQKVPLDERMAEKVVRWSQELRDIHTSMYDDWKAGRPTEIDFLNGYIALKGKECGIPTPVNEALTAMVKVITESPQPREGVLCLDGDVIQALSLDATALAKLPAEHQVPDVSVLAPGMQGVGVRMKGLLEIPTLQIGADHVTFHAQDGQFAASLTLDQAREFGLIIYGVDGQPLPHAKGGPFRFVAPGLRDLCANVKHVMRIEVTKGAGKDTRPSVKKH